jgi:ubiquinone/menaquinone biosynthesis C-methylase UbiE
MLTYQDLYSEENTPSWINAGNERKLFVEDVYAKISKPVSVLDIGCGNGKNTSWIGGIAGNFWTGIDIVPENILKVQIPKNGEFICGDFESMEITDKYNLIVDQGSCLASKKSAEEIKVYLNKIHKALDDQGMFITLTAYSNSSDSYAEVFPDGRFRMFFSKSDFESNVFSEKFEVIASKIITYSATSRSNPYSKLENNTKELSVIQVAFIKKTPLAS